jgi:hypothetical protein
MIANYLIGGGLILLCLITAVIFLYTMGIHKGKEKEKTEQLNNSVKEALDVKKDNVLRRSDNISTIRDRLRRFTRS